MYAWEELTVGHLHCMYVGGADCGTHYIVWEELTVGHIIALLV